MAHDHDHDHQHHDHDHDTHQHHDHGSHDHGSHDHGSHSRIPVDAPAEDVAECPVMPGNMVVKAEAEAAGLAREHQGKTYYLCCDTCGLMFDADPTKYAVA